MYFNLKTEQFTKTEPKEVDYIREAKCEHTGKVLELVYNEGNIHLHNEEFNDEKDEIKAVELFNSKSINFFEFVDMFTSKNPRVKNPFVSK